MVRQAVVLLMACGAITACMADGSGIGKMVREAIAEDELPDEARQALNRFRQVYEARAPEPSEEGFEHFRNALSRVHSDYVRDVDYGALIDVAVASDAVGEGGEEPKTGGEWLESALDAMLQSLDPHSDYLNPREYNEIRISTRGEFGGLGIEIAQENGLIKVISPIEDTPAFHAGIKAGDLITHVDGQSIEGWGLLEAVRRMRGPPGTDIELTVRREGRDPFKVAITRDTIQVRAVRWRMIGDMAYLRVASFNERVTPGVVSAFRKLAEEPAWPPRGLVLDLRNNPGGLLDQSVALADDFLDRGTIVDVRGRGDAQSRHYEAEWGDLARDLPMVVLINRGSASAAEIVAAALKDSGRATVMGGQSFGKGSVQTIFAMPDEGALRLTTALYYGPSGRSIQSRGVTPHIAIVPVEETARRREADLPGALPAGSTADEPSPVEVGESRCPAEGEGEAKDAMLGCALLLLQAGSAEAFLSTLPADR